MNDQLSHKLVPKPAACPNVVFLDGVSRSGKKLACRVVSNLKSVDHFQHVPAIENMLYLEQLKLVTPDTAAAFVLATVDEAIYSRAIGRNLNTRPGDESSVSKAPDADMYLARRGAPDGVAGMQAFNDAGRVALFHTHATLTAVRSAFTAVPGLRYIHISRHPVDVAESWLERGWGERHGKDPLSFRYLVDSPAGPVPWFAADWAEQFEKMSPSERCIESVARLMQASDETFAGLGDGEKKRVLRFSFETLATDPDKIIGALCTFLETTPGDAIPALLQNENCPRVIDLGERRQKFERVVESSSEGSIETLSAAAARYERQWEIESLKP